MSEYTDNSEYVPRYRSSYDHVDGIVGLANRLGPQIAAAHEAVGENNDPKRVIDRARRMAEALHTAGRNGARLFSYQWNAITKYTHGEKVIGPELMEAIHNPTTRDRLKLALLNQKGVDPLDTIVVTPFGREGAPGMVGRLIKNHEHRVVYRLGYGHFNEEDDPIAGCNAYQVSQSAWQHYLLKDGFVEEIVGYASNPTIRRTGHHTGFEHRTYEKDTPIWSTVTREVRETIGNPVPIYTLTTEKK